MFKKKDLKNGMMAKTRAGKITMYMDLKDTVFTSSGRHEGTFLGDGGLNLNSYDEDLLCPDSSNYDIMIIKQPNYPINLNPDKWAMTGDLIWERKELNPITSLDQLEEVRKELCKKYNTSFYITNKSGEFEIKFNGIVQAVGRVNDGNKNYINLDFPKAMPIINELGLEKEEKVYIDWESEGNLTSNPFRAVDLDKEGYELKL